MSITPEMARQELQRRQQERLSKSLGQEEQPNPLLQGIEAFNEYVGRPAGAAATGVVKGVAGAGSSLANLALMPFTDYRVPYYNPDELAQTPTEGMLMKVGEYAGQALPTMKGANLLTQAMKSPSFLKNVAASGALGYATGGAEENDQQSRIGSALLNAGLTGLTGLSTKAISQRVKPMYERVFGQLEKEGLANKPMFRLKETPKPDMEIPKKARDVLGKFFENPSYKQGHAAQSDLGKIIREMEKKFAKGAKKNAPPLDINVQQYNKLNDLRNQIKDSMKNYLERYGREGVSKSYEEATKRFAKEQALREAVVPKLKTGAKVGGAALAAKQILPYGLKDYGQEILEAIL